jgi:hypothetical protein
MAINDEAVDVLRKAIVAIDSERERLIRALDSLDGSSPIEHLKKPAAHRSAARKPRRRRKRAPKGSRRHEILAAIDRKPGITGARLANELGIPASQVYNICTTLLKEKTIRKRGVTYEMVPGAKVDGAR